MSIFGGNKKIKRVFIGNTKIKSIYLGADKIWSGASVVTYNVDVNTSYTEEIDEGSSVLTPQSFVPTKNGYTFLGWKDSSIASSSVIEEKVADGNPITLYAVFTKTITVTYRNYTVTSTATGTQYYNNSDTLNPSFTLTQTPISAWTARGWTTSASGGASAITYANGATFTRSSNITLYGCYYRTVTVSYNGNGATSGSTAASTGTAYYHSASGGTNASVYVRGNGFAKTNYSFVQWRLNGTSGTAYSAGSYYSSTADATMYAQWKVVQYTYLIQNGAIVNNGLTSGTISVTGACTGESNGFDVSQTFYVAQELIGRNVTVTIRTTKSQKCYDGQYTWYGRLVHNGAQQCICNIINTSTPGSVDASATFTVQATSFQIHTYLSRRYNSDQRTQADVSTAQVITMYVSN